MFRFRVVSGPSVCLGGSQVIYPLSPPGARGSFPLGRGPPKAMCPGLKKGLPPRGGHPWALGLITGKYMIYTPPHGYPPHPYTGELPSHVHSSRRRKSSLGTHQNIGKSPAKMPEYATIVSSIHFFFGFDNDNYRSPWPVWKCHTSMY